MSLYKLQFKDKTTLDIYSFFEISNGEALQIAVQNQTYDELKKLFENPSKTSEMIVYLNETEIGHYYSMTYITGWIIKTDENKISVTLKVSGYDDQIDILTSEVTEAKKTVVQLQEQVNEVSKITEQVNTLNTQVTFVENKVEYIKPTQYSAVMSLMVENAQAFTDDKALLFKDIYEDWKTDINYAQDYKVNYKNILYKCLQKHTSQATWTPDTAHSLWAKVLIPDPEVIPDWEQPLSTNGYKTGDRVKHKSKTWESLIDNNVWEPGAVGTESLWKEVTV